MAKEVIIDVKVKDEQFQQFMKNFNELADKIKKFQKGVDTVTDSIKKTTLAAKALQVVMDSLSSSAKSVWSWIQKSTGQLLKWSVIIGGISALLGMGGGLFGIERLAAQILQRRRMVMGLGGDYGRIQASMIYNQSILSSPQNVMQNIRLGLGGSTEQLTPLLSLGIPFGTKMSPDEVLTKILQKMPDLLKSAGPGMELQVARAYGLDKIFTDPMDLLRIMSEEGRKEILETQKKIESMKQEYSLSKEAQKVWSDLNLQLLSAKLQIEKIFGERLAKLAGPLSDVSAGFIKVFKIIMDSTLIEKILNKFKDWLNQLATWLESGEAEKYIKKFLGKIEEYAGKLSELMPVLQEFATTLKQVVDKLAWIWHLLNLTPGQALEEGAEALGIRPDPNAPSKDKPMARPGTGQQHPGPKVQPKPDKDDQPPPGTKQQQTIPNPFTLKPVNPTPSPAPAAPPSLPPGTLGFLGAPNGAAAGGGTFGGNTRFAAMFGGNRSLAVFGGGSNAGMFSNQNTNFGGGGINLASMTTTTKRFVPTDAGGGGGSRFSVAMGGMGGRGPGPGALDTDNWQMNRTASLVVRNVPGSNMFMSAVGMSA